MDRPPQVLLTATPLLKVAKPILPTPPIPPIQPIPPIGAQIRTAEEEEDADLMSSAVKVSRPWLLSCCIHALIILILGLIPLLIVREEPVELILSFTDSMGEQTELESFTDVDLLEPNILAPPTLDEFVVVDVPQQLLTPNPVAPSFDGLVADIGPPQMGQLLSGREKGMKASLLAAYGGSEKTEAAVLAGLRWLERRQDKDGTWSLSGRLRNDARSKDATYEYGGQTENKPAATAMAMLAFQGYGQTHQSGPKQEFERVMERAKEALVKRQSDKGDFTKVQQRGETPITSHHTFYTQAICTFALCELYAMSEDSALRVPAQKAVDYLVDRQDRQGGWRYGNRSGSDLSVTGWVVMALQSARMAGLNVPQNTLYRISGFLDKVAREGGRLYSYIPGSRWSRAMTAEGLLCRQYLGWAADNERLLEGVDVLMDNPIAEDYQDVYYWYYATQVLHNMEGDAWAQWNKTLSTYLPKKQLKKGRERGSWTPRRDAWGEAGGRLYTTCLSLYMLEVYYRHLPVYSLNLICRRVPHRRTKPRCGRSPDRATWADRRSPRCYWGIVRPAVTKNAGSETRAQRGAA
ncbi:MAG: terpene cyclase/mutase family protein [Planctomycetota bacterium]|nr:terpene cyclase/mutase family protein [Planctomycetota bacterium]